MQSQRIPVALKVFLLAALAPAAVLLVTLSDHAQAQIDISGNWKITLSGDRSDTCTAVYSQSGSDLSSETDCEVYGSATLSGTIDPSTGSFHLTGGITNAQGTTYQVDVLGTASLDGNSISGTWSLPDLGFSGTFVGVRQTAPGTPSPSPTSPPLATPTATPEEPQIATATPFAGGVILPETGDGPAAERNRVLPLLLGLGAVLSTLGVLGLKMRRGL